MFVVRMCFSAAVERFSESDLKELWDQLYLII